MLSLFKDQSLQNRINNVLVANGIPLLNPCLRLDIDSPDNAYELDQEDLQRVI